MFPFAAGTTVAESRFSPAMELICRLLNDRLSAVRKALAIVNASDRILRSSCAQLVGQRCDGNAECAAPSLPISLSDRPSSLPFLGHHCHRDPGRTYFAV
jgi:hypothetical protein